MPIFKFDHESDFYNIYVPTTDMMRFENLIRTLVRSHKNLVLMGDTGVGKSITVLKYI